MLLSLRRIIIQNLKSPNGQAMMMMKENKSTRKNKMNRQTQRMGLLKIKLDYQ